MQKPSLISIIESPSHPNLSRLYARLGLDELRVGSQRKAISQLKKAAPRFVVAEFFYAFSSYYQAVNISNLDVLLNSLVKYSPDTQVIALVSKAERPYVDKLQTTHSLHAVLVHPVSEAQMEALLVEKSAPELSR